MKQILLIFAAVFSFLFLLGCGEDGQPGKAYLSFDWDWYVDWYEDNNSDTPYSISRGMNYETSPGTYSYEYGCSDGTGYYWSWWGTYTITVNPGEESGWFSDGNNGADKFFQFLLYGSGPYFGKENLVNKTIKPILTDEYDNSNYQKVNIGEQITDVYKFKHGTLTVTRQACEWIKK